MESDGTWALPSGRPCIVGPMGAFIQRLCSGWGRASPEEGASLQGMDSRARVGTTEEAIVQGDRLAAGTRVVDVEVGGGGRSGDCF